MAWNKAMRAWASEGPKKAARRRGGRLIRAIRTAGCKRYALQIHITCDEEDEELAEQAMRNAVQEVLRENRRRQRHGLERVTYEAICEDRG